MQDIKIVPDNSGIFDLVIENGEFASVDGMQTMIEVTIFTDARAPESIVPDASKRRGWVGDITTALDGRLTGSNLWLLDQARLTADTISQAGIYANDAFLWMMEDSIASEVNVNIEQAHREISIEIEIVITDNIIERYNLLWRTTNATGLSNV